MNRTTYTQQIVSRIFWLLLFKKTARIKKFDLLEQICLNRADLFQSIWQKLGKHISLHVSYSLIHLIAILFFYVYFQYSCFITTVWYYQTRVTLSILTRLQEYTTHHRWCFGQYFF